MNALDIIERRESGGRNIYQQLVPRSVSSASGHFQMIKPTWQRWAKAVGIDTNQYPEAITAPYELQRKVAEHGFRTEGFKPWEATKHLVGQEANYSVGAPAGALNVNPAAAPSGGGLQGAFQTALKYQGMNETANKAALGEFMAEKGIPFTPQNIAWCARFVNSSLAAQGLPTTGSNMARSFLNWGEATAAPKEGDIAVFSRGDPNAPTGHVGFYGGTIDRDGQQYIRVFGGNQGGARAGGGGANWTELPASQLLGYRTMGGGAPVQDVVDPTAPAPEGLLETAMPSGLWQKPEEPEQQVAQPVTPPAPPAPLPPAQATAPADLMISLLNKRRPMPTRPGAPPGLLAGRPGMFGFG